jgi:tRNA modification GTPase
MEDTIAAVATAPGKGGIGIVRISGNDAMTIAMRLFRAAHGNGRFAASDFKPHRMHYGHIVSPVNDHICDEVLMVYMPGPHSYTRQDIVEIHSHGGPAVLIAILELVLEQGARTAEPGEFTRRAFLNGRIDLSQAEAVADMIWADSKNAVQLAAAQMHGGIKDRIRQILEALESLRADIEAHLEFPDDTPSIDDTSALRQLMDVNRAVRQLLESYHQGRLLRDGIRVTIAGRPNVGKSSLLNRLIGADKAIVTEFPGTTRDPVEARAMIRGFSVRFYDTAGIRSSSDAVESIGIRKSLEAMNDADMILMVVDATDLCNSGDIDIFQGCAGKPSILVVNKIDLMEPGACPKLPVIFNAIPAIFVSALEGKGLEGVKEQIVGLQNGFEKSGEDAIISNLRHKKCLEEALSALERAALALEQGIPDDLVSLDFKQGADRLRLITGEHFEDGLLDEIFQKFCIGK